MNNTLQNSDFKKPDELIHDEMRKLDKAGIKYEIDDYNNNKYAVILLENENKIKVNLYRKTVRVGIKTVRYKNFVNWLKKNNLTVHPDSLNNA